MSDLIRRSRSTSLLVALLCLNLFVTACVRVEGEIRNLNDKDAAVRQRAAYNLGEAGDTRAVEPLITALKDSNAEVRAAAAVALGNLKDTRAVQPLIDLLKDPDVWVKRRAIQSLGRLKDLRALEPLIASFSVSELETYASEALAEIGPAVVDRLIEVLRGSNIDARRWAASTLGKIKDSRAIEPLAETLRAKTLPAAEPGTPEYRIDTMNAHLRQAAASALGDIGDAKAIEPLIATLKDGYTDLANAAASALAKIGSPSVDPLIASLQDPRAEVRRIAAGALGEMNDPRATDFLLTALRDGNLEVVAGAHRFFVRRGEREAEGPLIRSLENYGNLEMAEYLLNCGNSELESAATSWAEKRGYKTSSLPLRGSGDRPLWGSGK